MPSTDTVAVVRGRIDAATALGDIAVKTAGVPVICEGSVLYPYVRFEARCFVPTISGKRAIALNCLVDAINNHGATADDFSTDEADVSRETVLKQTIAATDARRTAQRMVSARLGRKTRMIASFDVQLEERDMVYKRFWIMRAGNDRIMTDSVTGSMHTLQARAA